MATELKGELRQVPLKDLRVSGPTRTDVTPSDIAELAASLKRDDLIEPIVVAKRGDKYDLVAGDKRRMAAEKLGWSSIPAIVREMTDAELLRARWTENAMRSDWNAIDRARLVKEIVDTRRKEDPKATLDAIGAELGLKQTAVSHYLLQLEQPKEVQDLVRTGRLTPTHVVKAINPLENELKAKGADDKTARALVAAFADQIAHGREHPRDRSQAEALDVDTSAKMVPEWVRDYEAETKKAGIRELMDKWKAKVRKCPFEGQYATSEPEKGYEAEGRLVLIHRDRYETEDHRWYADNGEQYLTAQEKKELERKTAREAKDRKEAAKQRRKAAPKEAEKVDLEPAVWFSRASPDEWHTALAKTLRTAGVGDICIRGNGVDVLPAKEKVPIRVPGDGEIYLTAVKMPDGKGGTFPTRVQIGAYKSESSAARAPPDWIGEGNAAKEIRRLRAELLEYQRKQVGVKQADDDLWPAAVGGFRVGDKVKVPGKVSKAVVLGFDVEAELNEERSLEGRAIDLGDTALAFVGTGRPQKLHPVSALEKLTKFGCAKCGGKARVVDGKRICDACAKAEASCECPPKKEKGAPKKARAK